MKKPDCLFVRVYVNFVKFYILRVHYVKWSLNKDTLYCNVLLGYFHSVEGVDAPLCVLARRYESTYQVIA